MTNISTFRLSTLCGNFSLFASRRTLITSLEVEPLYVFVCHNFLSLSMLLSEHFMIGRYGFFSDARMDLVYEDLVASVVKEDPGVHYQYLK